MSVLWATGLRCSVKPFCLTTMCMEQSSGSQAWYRARNLALWLPSRDRRSDFSSSLGILRRHSDFHGSALPSLRIRYQFWHTSMQLNRAPGSMCENIMSNTRSGRYWGARPTSIATDFSERKNSYSADTATSVTTALRANNRRATE